jgi:CHAT domain-containing protein
MAVMAGMYRSGSGLQPLPNAQQEAKSLVQQYGAIPLAASRQALKQLLDGTLVHELTPVGAAEVVHFAGHGQFDPMQPDASVLYLDDGTPLSSFLFRSARCCEKQQALLFLNACMIGIGGELLGDMGGFPGNCLKGGFGGMLGALWEVDDEVAADVALEFWHRALPPKGSAARPEPVGAILRDLRAKYVAATPQTTYLAYVYYGHPRLTLGAA